MAPTLKKTVNTFTTAFGAVSILLIVILTIADKKKVLDFLTDTFKLSWLFWLFISLFIAWLVSLAVNKRSLPPDTGLVFSTKPDPVRTGILRYNTRLKNIRIATGSLAALCLCILLWFEFRTLPFGIYGGSFGSDQRFNQQIQGKVRDTGRVSGFDYHADPAMPYLEDPEKEKKLFHRYYRQGILYTGQYDNADRDSIINLEVRWMGDPMPCTFMNHFTGEFSKCTVDVNADANLIASFILGFARMHRCDTEGALACFNRVYSDIDGIENAHVRARMAPLRDSLDRYCSRMRGMTASMADPNVRRDARRSDTMHAGFRAVIDSPTGKGESHSPTSGTDSPRITNGNPLAGRDDILPDTFSTLPIDTARALISEVDMTGQLTLHQPGTTDAGVLFTLYPIYVYKWGKDYYVAYQLHKLDTYFTFLNLRTKAEERHSLDPLTADQIEKYVSMNYPGAPRFKFSRPARVLFFDNSKVQPPPSKYSGVTVTLFTGNSRDSVTEAITTLKVSNPNQGKFAVKAAHINDLLTHFPLHILTTDEEIVLIFKNDQSFTFTEYEGKYSNGSTIQFQTNNHRQFNADAINLYIRGRYPKYFNLELQKAPEYSISR